MATLSTLSTPIATKLINEDGTINHVWNEFFVRLMVNAGLTVQLDALEVTTQGLQVQVDAVGTELAASATITDSDESGTNVTDILYDGYKTTGGVIYSLSGTDKYIQYAYSIINYFDRIGIWCDDAGGSLGRVYIALSDDEETWTYYSAESDHTLTSEGRLVSQGTGSTGLSDAQTDYWELAAGTNIAIFPNNTSAKYVRVWLLGTYSITIYEIIPSRMVLAELGVIENLAAISATFGPVGGYADITDKPSSLSDINSTEGLKLTGIADGAEVNTIDAGDGLAALDTNADGMLSNLDNAAYFPGTMNFNPFGSVLTKTGAVAGWWRNYILTGTNPIYYDATEDALALDNGLNSSMVCAAFPVVAGSKYLCKIKFRTLAAHTNGLYVRILEYDSELPDGKYAVGYSSGDHDSEVIFATRNLTVWLENVATTTSYTIEEYTYSPTSTAKWISIAIWDWAGIGTDTLFIKYLTVVNTATNDLDIRYTSDTTKIDGGKIYTETIVANSIAANAITAAKVGTNEIIASAANIKNAVITGAKIGNLEVDTAQIAGNAVTVPMYVASTITPTGTGSYIKVCTVTVALAISSYILAWASIDQDFSTYSEWSVYLSIDGTTVFETGGLGSENSVSVSGAKSCAAGNRVVELYWKGADSNAYFNDATLAAQGAMK